MHNNVWSTNTSGTKTLARPIPLSLSIPGSYTATASGGPILIDRFTVQFPITPPLIIPTNCGIHLTSASFAYSQPNVVDAGFLQSVPNGNNRLSVKFGADPYVDIILEPGLYDFQDVQTALNIYARTVGSASGVWVTGTTDLFILSGISATQKIIFSINPAAIDPTNFPPGGQTPAGGIIISFVNPSPTDGVSNDSIGPILGYPTTGAGSSFTVPAASTAIYSSYAPNVAGFSNTSAYTLYMSIIDQSYQNGVSGQLLFSFPLGDAEPNSVVSFQPTQRYVVPIMSGTFSAVSVWTADQDGNKLPLQFYQAPFQFSCLITKNRDDGSI